MISELRAELRATASSERVGSGPNSRLSQLSAATLHPHPEIVEALLDHGFVQGDYASQFRSQLTTDSIGCILHTNAQGYTGTVRG